MAFANKFIEKQKNDILKQIKSYLYIDVNKEKFDVSDVFLKKDLVTSEILKTYNARTGSDFQKSLISMISPSVLDKLNDNVIEKSEKELGIEIDDSKKEEFKENKELVLESNIKEEIIKYTYEVTLDKYNKLREELYTKGFDSQISTGDISVGEKMSTELLVYENYLKKVDLKYKEYTGKFIFENNPEIQKKEELYRKKINENQQIVNEKALKNNKKIDDLNEKIDLKTEEIIKLKNNMDSMDYEKYRNNMDNLLKEYLDDFKQLRYLEMDVLDINNQLKEKQIYEKNRENENIESYEENKNKKLNNDVKLETIDTREEEDEIFEDTKINVLETKENIGVVLNENENGYLSEINKQVEPLSEQIKNYEKRLTSKEKKENDRLEKENEGRE